MIYQFEDRIPVIGQDVFVAESADVIGSVELRDFSSVWFNAVIRGDLDGIVIGANTNVQDNAVIHTEIGAPVHIGAGVTIGHCAMVHGCSIGDDSLIGINSVILDRAEIGKGCLVGANALVPEGMKIPDYSLVVGTPARVIRQLDEKAVDGLRQSAELYLKKAAIYRCGLKKIVVD